MDFLDDIANITIDDEMLKLLRLTKEELQEILVKHYVKNIDYVDLQKQTDEEIEAFDKKCKLEKRKKEMFAFAKKMESHPTNLSKEEKRELYTILEE